MYKRQGQGNAIEREEMPAGSYSVVWDEGSKAGDTWRYSIKGLQEGELERYAPNGMPWRYEVTETLPEGSLYTMSPGTVAQQGSKEGENVLSVTMHPLGNTILTKAPYSKNWVDSSGDIISEDYLGLNLSVTFQLQVAEPVSYTPLIIGQKQRRGRTAVRPGRGCRCAFPGGRKRQPGTFRKFFLFRRLGL